MNTETKTDTKTETKNPAVLEEPLHGLHPLVRATQPLEFSDSQRKMIRDTFLNGATDAEAAVLMELARLKRLNPLTRQIHFVKRWDSMKNCEVWSAQVSIDGFRAIADRTGKYAGQDEPEFIYEGEGKAKKLVFCRVKIHRTDWGDRPAIGIAHFSEYAQTKKGGDLTHMWATKPHVMLAKCAEANAHRKAFPEDAGGLYIEEEMEKEINAAPTEGISPGAVASVAAKVADKVNAQRSAPKASQSTVDASKPAAKPVEKPAPVAKFGPKDINGKKLSELASAQLSSLIDLGTSKLQAEPNAAWAAGVKANLEEIDAEIGARIAAEKAEKEKAQTSAPAPDAKTDAAPAPDSADAKTAEENEGDSKKAPF